MAPRRKNTASTAVAGADQISGEESRPKAKQKRTRKETRTAKAKAKGKQRAVAAHESDADDDDEPSAHEEIAPEPEAPKSLLPYQVRESAQEMVENQKIMKKLASIDEAEEAKQTAVFSYNVIDITQPPLPFTNLYNPRPLQPTRVVAMRNALIDEGFRVFAHENRIMIVISPSHVDLECITMDPNEEPKQLVLKKPCPLDSLSIIGGQHRQEAVIHIKKEYKKKLANVVTAIERRKTKRSGLRAADSEQKDRLSKQIQELEAERAQYLRSLEFVGPWGVLLLNPEKLTHQVCESLARNRKVVTYSETDGEKIHMYLNIWNEIKPRKSELSRSDFLQLAKNVIPDRRLLHIMEDPAINELFEVQRKAPIPWMLSAEWKINWLSRVLVSPAGGLIARLGVHMHDELTHMISADKLLDPKDQQQYSMLSEMGDKISDGDVVWMMDTYWKGKQKFYQSTPDFEDLLIDSSLIHGVDKLSQDFNQKSHCFGFDVPDYNNAFLPYEKKLAELLGERIKSIRSNLSIDRRETATAIADNLKSRVQFVYGSTLFTRTRLPILTPNTFRPMAETFMRFPDAITELVNQIYPLAQYCLPRGGQTLLPRNLTTWLFEEFRNERTSHWTREYSLALPSIFTNLIFININTLAQLEIDLASSEMVKNSSRPVGDVYDESYKQWLTTIKKGFASGLCPYDLEKLKEDMLRFRANNMSRDKETGLKYLADGPWPLNVASFHHWSSKTVKNPKRDTPKYALVSLAEIVVVSGYRADLLKKSHAARFFRTEIRKILNRNLKELQGSAGLAVQGTGWDFPDGIECKDQHSVETENVDQLLQQHAYVRDGKGGAQEITGLINRIIKQPIALMKPWDPEYAGMVAPEVHEGLQNLFAVLKRNQVRQWTMRAIEASGVEELDLNSWDQKPKYKVPDWQPPEYKVWTKPEGLIVEDLLREDYGELVDSAMDLNYWSVDDADRDGAADDDMDAASHVSQGEGDGKNSRVSQDEDEGKNSRVQQDEDEGENSRVQQGYNKTPHPSASSPLSSAPSSPSGALTALSTPGDHLAELTADTLNLHVHEDPGESSNLQSRKRSASTAFNSPTKDRDAGRGRGFSALRGKAKRSEGVATYSREEINLLEESHFGQSSQK